MTFSNGIDFQCSFGNSLFSNPVGSVYTCSDVRITNSNTATSLESVYGIHESGKSNLNVKALFVSGDETRLQKLPTNIESFFPNLEVLVWQYGNLESITADDLQPFPELKLLHLFRNEIVSLDSDLFQHSPKLVLLEMAYNQLTNVGIDLLKNLNDLEMAFLSGNPCIDFNAFTPETILELKEKLLIQCPPLTTTTTVTSTIATTTTLRTTTEETCDIRCTVNDEIDELKEIVKVLNETNSINEKRVLQLENQMKEILSRP